jgi:hypothetical protein
MMDSSLTGALGSRAGPGGDRTASARRDRVRGLPRHSRSNADATRHDPDPEAFACVASPSAALREVAGCNGYKPL